jgi:hypothetical protein
MKVSRFLTAAGQSELVSILQLVLFTLVLFGCASPSPSYEGGRRLFEPFVYVQASHH